MTISVTSRFLIGQDQAYPFLNEDGFVLEGDGVPELINRGQISLRVTDSVSAAAVHATADGARIVNRAGGEIDVKQAQVAAEVYAVLLESDDQELINQGTISYSSRQSAAAISSTGAGLHLLNSGRMAMEGTSSAAVVVADASASIENKGKITVEGFFADGVVLQSSGSAAGRLTNSGMIRATGEHGAAAINLFNATEGFTVVNSGVIVGEATVDGSAVAAIVLPDTSTGQIEIDNTGTIRGGIACFLSDGPAASQIIVNSGSMEGAISLASGDDRIVNTGRVTDQISLGDGSDVYLGGHGVAKREVFGGAGDDVLVGGREAEMLYGDAIFSWKGSGDGADDLSGGKGDDSLYGGRGADTLIGGAGADALSGGGGADVFAYGAVRDSTAHHFDLIGDLKAGSTIDLSAIDADIAQAGDQAFELVDTFSGRAGELTLTFEGGKTWLRGDVDGDGKAELVIAIAGDHTDFSGLLL